MRHLALIALALACSCRHLPQDVEDRLNAEIAPVVQAPPVPAPIPPPIVPEPAPIVQPPPVVEPIVDTPPPVVEVRIDIPPMLATRTRGPKPAQRIASQLQAVVRPSAGVLWKATNHSGDGTVLMLRKGGKWDGLWKVLLTSDPWGENTLIDRGRIVNSDGWGHHVVRFDRTGITYRPGPVYAVVFLRERKRIAVRVQDPAVRAGGL